MPARSKVIALPLAALLLASCAGAGSGGGSSPGVAAGSTASGGGASATAGAATSGGSAASPAAGGGAAGGTVAKGGDPCGLLASGDFGAAGVTGTGPVQANNTDNNNAYCVYAGKSAAAGGVELDVFILDSPAAAKSNFGGTAMYTLDAASIAALGADDAGFYDDQLGNTAGTTFDELRALKGRLWFDLGIPSSANSKDQLLTLGKLVLSRAQALE